MPESTGNLLQRWAPDLLAWVTTVTGLVSWWAVINHVLSAATMASGLFFTIALGYGRIKKGRVERQILYLQRDILAEREHERLEKVKQRKSDGYPCLRGEDGTGAQCDS